MTGMKEGAGEDPFADDDADTTDDSDETIEAAAEAEPTAPDQSDETEPSEQASESTSDETAAIDVPYTLRRNSVQDGRDRYPLFLM